MFKEKVRAKVMKKKPTLSALLHETIQRQRDEIKVHMFKFPYFNYWSEPAIRQCCFHSNVLFFDEDDIIKVKDDANVDVTYFVLEGSVTVIRRLVVKKYKLRGEKHLRYQLHPNQSLLTSQRPKNFLVEFVYMQICILSEGACFGLGEELSNYVLKANKGLKCLVIPKHIILQNFTPDNVWKKIIVFLNMNFPPLKKVFELFVAGREWSQILEPLIDNEKLTENDDLQRLLEKFSQASVNRYKEKLLEKKFKKAGADISYLFGSASPSDVKKGRIDVDLSKFAGSKEELELWKAKRKVVVEEEKCTENHKEKSPSPII